MKKHLFSIILVFVILTCCAYAESSTSSEVPRNTTPSADSNTSGASETGSSYETLKKGSKGAAVVALQQRLIDLGYLEGKADGSYGNKTIAAVSLLQKHQGFEESGIADEGFQMFVFSDSVKTFEEMDNIINAPENFRIDLDTAIKLAKKYTVDKTTRTGTLYSEYEYDESYKTFHYYYRITKADVGLQTMATIDFYDKVGANAIYPQFTLTFWCPLLEAYDSAFSGEPQSVTFHIDEEYYEVSTKNWVWFEMPYNSHELMIYLHNIPDVMEKIKDGKEVSVVAYWGNFKAFSYSLAKKSPERKGFETAYNIWIDSKCAEALRKMQP